VITARRLAAVVAVLALVAACGGDDPELDRAGDATTSSTTSTSSPTTRPTDPTEPQVTPVDWQRCGSAECATVPVPLDHDDPDGEQIDLFVKRLPATGDRLGALFVNFGGPGAGAADLIERFPIDSGVRARFDIVGMDPRGVGRSSPLGCGLDPATLYGVDPTVEDPADARALITVSEEYAADCAEERGGLLPHVGTRDVARDMDAVRAAMADETLSFLGYSYGTSIGQVYAELFPERIRALVLDGVVDPAPSGIEVAEEQARGFEVALANWAEACPSRSSCPFGDKALAMVDKMLARSESTVASSGGARPLGRGEASVGLAFPLYQEALWGALDQAVADALAGDGAGMVALADRYLGLVDFSAYFAVSCLDSEWPDGAEAMLAAAEQAGAASPRFGEAIVNDYLRCAVWPAEPDPIGAVEAPGSPPILVVSTTGDPATPYENGVRVAERLKSGVLLTNQGEGHTIVFQGSPCVDAIVVAYLVDGRTPEDGARC
jgi:pimeloyl-ACP methyl ester carboxylesterase